MKVWYRKRCLFQSVKQRIFCYVYKNIKKKNVVHNDPIHRPDLQYLYTLFNLEEADRLQNKVFVDEMLYFCNGEGLDNWRLATLPLARILKADDLCVW